MADINKTVVVTGSSGLIGRAVCKAFASDGYAVVGLDRAGGAPPPPEADNVECDLTSDSSVSDALAQIRRRFGDSIASVIHLAAYYDFSGEPSPLYETVTVRGTERLLRSLRDFRVEQFVFSSTMLVHAPCEPGQHIDENWPLEPKWDYPESKVRTERLMQQQRRGIPVVLLRIAGVYTDRCQSIPIAHQIQRIYEGRLTAHVFPGDINTGQSFVHLDDLVQAFRAVVARRGQLPAESTILIGESEPLSYDQMQRELGRLIHDERDWDTAQIPKAVAKAGAWVQDKIPGIEEPFIKPWMIDLADDHYALDITRARQLLNWTPQRNLRDTLPKMIQSLKADPAGWYRRNKLEGTPPAQNVPASGRPRSRMT
jgi:nucleoside-diphosphate-sugar epimerase